MRHSALRNDFVTQRAFGAKRELVLGGLAIDQNLDSARMFGRICAPALLRSSPTTNRIRNCARLFPAAHSSSNHRSDNAFGVARAAAPDERTSTREGMKGGTVSIWVERTTVGSPNWTKMLSRCGSTGIRSILPSNRVDRSLKSCQRKSPTSPSFGVIDSMSISFLVSSKRSMR